MDNLVTGFQIAESGVYALLFGDRLVDLSKMVGQQITIKHHGELACCVCQRRVKKLYQNGYCFPCTRSLARCDLCVLKPELCHFHLGTCREPQWGMDHCMQPHVVYISWTSAFKVGLTRRHRLHQRWREQGATGGVALFHTATRYQAGLIETALAKHMSDKTNWRQMLNMRENGLEQWLAHEAKFRDLCQKVLEPMKDKEQIQVLDESWQCIDYRFNDPVKVHSLSLEPNTSFTRELLGFRGHYMIFQDGVLGMRKLVGHVLEIQPA